MRQEKLMCETGRSLLLGRLTASYSLFDMLPEVGLDQRTGGNLHKPAARDKCWTTMEERKPIVVISKLPQLSKLSVERLKPGDLKRLETEGLAHLTFCVSVYRWQSEKKRKMIMVEQTDESVVFLSRHNSALMTHLHVWRCYVAPNGEQIGATTDPNDEQD